MISTSLFSTVLVGSFAKNCAKCILASGEIGPFSLTGPNTAGNLPKITQLMVNILFSTNDLVGQKFKVRKHSVVGSGVKATTYDDVQYNFVCSKADVAH